MLTLECELTGLDCPWRSQRWLGVERPEGAEAVKGLTQSCSSLFGAY